MAKAKKKAKKKNASKKSMGKKSKSVKSKTSSSPVVSVDEIWPQERDYMTRPERFKYVRKILQPKKCVFCHARDVGPSFKSLCLYQDEHAMVVLNKFPYNSGHLLVLPTRHCGSIFELSEAEYDQLSQLVRATARILQESYECAGLNFGMNHGAVAGAGIPEHLHWHIIPRWSGDTNFFPLIAETKVLPETLEQTYDRLKGYFQGEGA